MIGVSIALSISNIPWKGPISGVSVGYIDGEYIINPTAEQRERSEMAVTVASTDKLVAMIEAGAKEVSNDVMFNGIMPAMRQTSRSSNSSKKSSGKLAAKKLIFRQTIPLQSCLRL